VNANSSIVVKVNGRSYFVLETIGKGGSSKVYRVLSQHNKLYALKRVELSSGSSSGCDAELASMYMNEIQLLKQFGENPYVVKLFDYEIVESTGIINMVSFLRVSYEQV
jgi:serine/threonine protein kinase